MIQKVGDATCIGQKRNMKFWFENLKERDK